MDNEGYVYVRKVTTFADTAALIGGIARTIMGVFEIFLLLAASPFRELNLALSFQSLKEKHLGDKVSDD